MRFKIPIIVFVLLVPVFSLFGQVRTTDRYPQYGNTREEQRRRNLDADRRRRAMQGDNRRFGIRTNRRRVQKTGVWRRVTPVFSEAVVERLRIGPALETEFSGFLSEPNTGLTRFLTADIEKCKDTDVVCVQTAADILAFGTSYSFRRQKHVPAGASDIRYEDGEFTAPSTAVQGILVDLGKVPLESVGPETPEIVFLTDFKPATEFEKAVGQYNELLDGIKAGGNKFSKTVKAKLQHTYALRSIAYRNLGNNGIEGGLDVIVAFRIVREDDDGTLLVAWKELARKYAPEVDGERY